MKYADAEKLLRWATSRFLPWTSVDLALRLSVEGTPDRVVPAKLRRALTAFRHQTQEHRRKMAARFLEGRKP